MKSQHKVKNPTTAKSNKLREGKHALNFLSIDVFDLVNIQAASVSLGTAK